MKRCKFCQEEINGKAKVCPKCGQKQKSKKWLIILGGLIIFILIIIGSSSNNEENNEYGNNQIDNKANVETNNSSNSNDNIIKNGNFSFNQKFIFDELEITIGNEYSFVVVNNRYSEYNNQTAVKLPITVKNLKSETHSLNMFYYSIFGSKGTEIKELSSYFDESIDYAGDLRTGASYTKYFYFLYDGNGEYAIEFDNYSQKITVEFEINK